MAGNGPNATDISPKETSKHPTVDLAEITYENVNTKHRLGLFTLIALGFNVCNTWAAVSSSMQVALLQGGPAALLYGLFVTTSLFLSIGLSMAELSSVYPTAGGQYHFTSIIAPCQVRRASSYICGFTTVLSWQIIGATVTMVATSQIITVWQFYHPSLQTKSWHSFFIYEAFGLFAMLYNNLVLPRVPWTHGLGCKLPSICTHSYALL